MTSLETRSTSALLKRAEQLKRWHQSDTARESANPRTSTLRRGGPSPPSTTPRPPKVQFTDGCVFLAACAAGDKDEVSKMVDRGADIDTANVDGLTALHQVGTDHVMLELAKPDSGIAEVIMTACPVNVFSREVKRFLRRQSDNLTKCLTSANLVRQSYLRATNIA